MFSGYDQELEAFRSLESILVPSILDEPVHPRSFDYILETPEVALTRQFGQKQVFIVYGGYMGDEAKGQLVANILESLGPQRIYDLDVPVITICVRTNSGQNAAHSVPIPGTTEKITGRIIPSGILTQGVRCYIGPGCVLDPVDFMDKEYLPLKAKLDSLNLDLDIENRLFMGDASLILPHLKVMDIFGKGGLYSTMTGISPVHASIGNRTNLRIHRLFQESRDDVINHIISDLSSYYGLLDSYFDSNQETIGFTRDAFIIEGHFETERFYHAIETHALGKIDVINKKLPGRIAGHIINFLGVDGGKREKAEFIYDSIIRPYVTENSMFPKLIDVKADIARRLLEGEGIMVEAAQSDPLSGQNEKGQGEGTSADTSMMGTLAATGIDLTRYSAEAIANLKFPQSKVGAGANPGGWVPNDWFSKRKLDNITDLMAEFEYTPDRFAQVFNAWVASIQPNGLARPEQYEYKPGSFISLNEAMAVYGSIHFKEFGGGTKRPRILGPLDLVYAAEVMRQGGRSLALNALDRFDGLDHVPVVVGWAYFNPEGRDMEYAGRTYTNGTVIRPGEDIPNNLVMAHCKPLIRLVEWKGTKVADLRPGDALPEPVQDLFDVVEHYINRGIPEKSMHLGTRVAVLGNGVGPENRLYVGRLSLEEAL